MKVQDTNGLEETTGKRASHLHIAAVLKREFKNNPIRVLILTTHKFADLRTFQREGINIDFPNSVAIQCEPDELALMKSELAKARRSPIESERQLGLLQVEKGMTTQVLPELEKNGYTFDFIWFDYCGSICEYVVRDLNFTLKSKSLLSNSALLFTTLNHRARRGRVGVKHLPTAFRNIITRSNKNTVWNVEYELTIPYYGKASTMEVFPLILERNKKARALNNVASKDGLVEHEVDAPLLDGVDIVKHLKDLKESMGYGAIAFVSKQSGISRVSLDKWVHGHAIPQRASAVKISNWIHQFNNERV